MNYFRNRILLPRAGRAALLLPLLFLFSLQAAEPAGSGRWLLIFDTSASMKKLQPETVAAAKELFTTSAEGQLQPGDSMAIWTVNRQVASQFSPFTWSPDQCNTAVSNLAVFLQKQPFATPSQLATLRMPLNSVVAGSRQLTAVIFTDGQSDLGGTPYDEGINQTFRDQRAQAPKSSQLLMLVLRSDRGKFVGCTMNYPPGAISLPPFPPQPVITNKPVEVVSQPAPEEPARPLTSLVIVGNNVSTNGSQPVPSFTPKSVVVIATNPAPATPVKVASATPILPVVTNPPVAVTNRPPAMATHSPALSAKSALTSPPATTGVKTTPPPVSAVASMPLPTAATNSSQTNPLLSTAIKKPSPPPSRTIFWVLAGGGVLILAGVVVFFATRRAPQSSLISASMDDEKQPRR